MDKLDKVRKKIKSINSKESCEPICIFSEQRPYCGFCGLFQKQIGFNRLPECVKEFGFKEEEAWEKGNTSKIKEAYKKYKHLDEIITRQHSESDSFSSQIIYDLWDAIKEHTKEG